MFPVAVTFNDIYIYIYIENEVGLFSSTKKSHQSLCSFLKERVK
jgi:hypothetical protein